MNRLIFLLLLFATYVSAETLPEALSNYPTNNGALGLSAIISPASLSADQNNYAPTGLAAAGTVRLTSSVAVNITGLSATGIKDGAVKLIHNIGSSNIVLKNNSSSSSAANRFQLGADVTLASNAVAVLQYDLTSTCWRAVSGGGGAGGAPISSTYITETADATLTNEFALGSLATGILKNTTTTGVPTIATAKTDYWDTTDFTASGTGHAHGLVPDPGATAGTTKFLREDATWIAPAGSASVTGTGFWHSTSGTLDSTAVGESGTGAVIRANGSTITAGTYNPNASSGDAVYGVRFSDTTPSSQTGHLIRMTATNGTTNVFTVKNDGTVDTGAIATSVLGSGTASSSTFLRGDLTWAAATGSVPNYTWLNNTQNGIDAPVGVPFNVSITGYNLNSAANTTTTLFTVPSGKTAVLISWQCQVTTRTGTGTTAAVLNVKDNTASTTMSPANLTLGANPNSGIITYPASNGNGQSAAAADVVVLNQVTQGVGATTLTGRVDAIFMYQQ